MSHPSLLVLDGIPVIGRLLSYPGFLVPVCVRIPAPIAVAIAAYVGVSTFVPLLVVCAANMCVTLRCPQGNDGSDQMASLVLITSTLAEGIGTPNAKIAALLFVCGQAALAYGTSGLLKVMNAGWYDGSFVVEVLKTSSSATDHFADSLRPVRPTRGLWGGWSPTATVPLPLRFSLRLRSA